MANIGRYDRLLLVIAVSALVVGIGHEVRLVAGQTAPAPLAIAGQVGGSVTAVAADGQRIVVGAGQRVHVLSADDLDHPRSKGASPLLPAAVRDLALADHYAYAALGESGLAVVDTGPADAAAVTPEVITVMPLAHGVVRLAVQSSAQRLLAVGDGRLWVLDLRNPALPAVLGHTLLGGSPIAVASVGGVAYVLGTDGITSVDVSDPTVPTVFGTMGRGQGTDIVATPDGRSLLLAGDNDGLSVVDVTDPSRARIVTRLAGQVSAVAIAGPDRAYVAGALDAAGQGGMKNGLWVVDIADLARPRQIGLMPLVRAPFRMALGPGTAWLATTNIGLTAVDTATSPGAPMPRGTWAARSVDRVVMDAGRAYVLAGREIGAGDSDSQWLEIHDVTQPAAPRLLGQVFVPTRSGALAVAGQRVYVAAGYQRLAVVDVADPAAPQLLPLVAVPGEISGMLAARGHLWLAMGYSHLAAYSLAQPDRPTQVGTLETPGQSLDLDVVGTTAYVADNGGGLLVVDIAEPTLPKIIGRLNPSAGYPGPDAPVHGVRVAGDLAYAWRQDGTMVMVDIKNAAAPKERGATKIVSGAYAASMFAGLAVVANWRSTYSNNRQSPQAVQLVDASNPDQPRRLDGPMLDADVADVASDDKVVALAAGNGGLVLLRRAVDVPVTATHVPPPAPTSPPRPTRAPVTPDPVWRKRLVLPLVLVPAAKLPPGPALHVVDEQGGSVTRTAVDGKRLIALVGNRVEVYSLADAAAPTLMGRADALPGYPLQLMARGGWVYCLMGTYEPQVNEYPELHLFIVDARDGLSPALMSDTLVSSIWPGDTEFAPPMAVTDGRVYVQTVVQSLAGDETAAIVVIDTLDPSRPRLAGQLPVVDPRMGALAVSGDLLIVLGQQPVIPDSGDTGEPALGLWDMRDLKAPRLIGKVAINFYWAIAARVVGELVYIGSGSGLQIVDIADTTQPRLVSEYHGTDDEGLRVDDLAVAGKSVYVADGNNGTLTVVDASDPATPLTLAKLEVPGASWYGLGFGAQFLAVSDGYLFMPGGGAGTVRVFDVRDSQAPTETASVQTPGLMGCLALAGERLIIGQLTASQVTTWRLTQPEQPARAGMVPVISDSFGIDTECEATAVGDVAYVASRGGYVNVLDIGNLAAPRSVGTFHEPGSATQSGGTTGLAVADGLGWLAQSADGLLGLDMRLPDPRGALARIGSPDASHDVALLGQLALVADGQAGLSVIDMTNPAQPRIRGHVSVAGSADLVAVAGQTVWLTVRRVKPPLTVVDPATLLAIDTSDPDRPRVIGQLGLPASPSALAAEGDRVWLATDAGLLVVAANDRSPRLIARSASTAYLRDVAARGDFAYAVSLERTLVTYRLGP